MEHMLLFTKFEPSQLADTFVVLVVKAGVSTVP